MAPAASKRPKEQQEETQHVSTGSTCCSAAPSQPTGILLPSLNGFLPPSVTSPNLHPCLLMSLCSMDAVRASAPDQKRQHNPAMPSLTHCPATAQGKALGKGNHAGLLEKKKSQGLSRTEHGCLSDEAAEEWQDSAEAAGSWPSCSDGARH